MAMTLLTARKRPDNTFHICVHLDNTQTLEDGSPDPAYIRQYDWPQKPAGVTQADYVAQVKAETKLLCQLELANMTATDNDGTALAGEGATL